MRRKVTCDGGFTGKPRATLSRTTRVSDDASHECGGKLENEGISILQNSKPITRHSVSLGDC
jgi:hypothetical protein